MVRFYGGLIAIGLATASPVLAQGHPADASRLLSAGIQDYYRGLYIESIYNLDMAAGYDDADPRIYFFRGLARLRQGQSEAASADFLMGSQLEIALKRRDVGQALVRVQGPDRMLIERYRRDARRMPEQLVQRVVPRSTMPLAQNPTGRRRPQPATKAQFTLPDLAADASDPFRSDAPGLLGRGDLEVAAEAPADNVAGPTKPVDDPERFAVDDFGGENPFGTGVVPEATSEDDIQDPFALNDDSGTSAASTDQASDGPKKSGGAFGAAMRAFSRTVGPAAAMAEQGGKLLKTVTGTDATADAKDSADPFGSSAPANDDDPSGGNSSPNSDDPFGSSAPANDNEPSGGSSSPNDDDPFGSSAPANDNEPSGGSSSPNDDDPFGDSSSDDADSSSDEPSKNSDDDSADPFADDPFQF